MTVITDEMVERAAKAHNPLAFEMDEGEYIVGDIAREYARIEVRDILTAALSDQVVVPRPLSEWHEDMGPMLWWCWESPKAFEQISERVVSSAHDGQWLGEAPWCGTPNDLGHEVLVEMHISTSESENKDDPSGTHRFNVGGWPGYHTHFTPITMPAAPTSTSGEV